jgi:hypothetical protein
MTRLIALAFAMGLSAGAANAMPMAPAQAPADIVIKVAGGCGPGWHRGPYGGCRRNFKPGTYHPCPRGFHIGPGGHCRANGR